MYPNVGYCMRRTYTAISYSFHILSNIFLRVRYKLLFLNWIQLFLRDISSVTSRKRCRRVECLHTLPYNVRTSHSKYCTYRIFPSKTKWRAGERDLAASRRRLPIFQVVRRNLYEIKRLSKIWEEMENGMNFDYNEEQEKCTYLSTLGHLRSHFESPPLLLLCSPRKI